MKENNFIMKKYIKKLIINHKIFQVMYTELNYLISVPYYFFCKKIAIPLINVEHIKRVIFIAHPDDEILSMGNFIINQPENLLVICFTNGGNKVRLKEFKSAMESLKIKYQIWNFKDGIDCKWSEKHVLKKINKVLKLKREWEMVITHNTEGDYGHFQHKEVSRLVRKAYKGDNLFSPILSENLFNNNNKLLSEEAKSKKEFFEKHYKSQKHILTLYDKYFQFEKIIKC